MQEMKITLEEELYIKIADASYDGIFITDHQGLILYFNDAYLRISGLKSSELSGQHIQKLLVSKAIPDSCSLEAINKKKPVSKMIDYYSGISALITSMPVFNEGGELIRVFSNVRDITELLKLQEKLKSTRDLNKEYRKQIRQLKHDLPENRRVIFKSAVMQNILRLARRVADVKSPVLIQGESGVGKDVIARYIHDAAEKSEALPFIQINCSAIPETLLESELFGYESGAFTGAAKGGKRGLFELANGGTLFLNEIGEMPLSTQVKLLDILQSNKIFRLGGTKTVSIDTRIITATNSSLEILIESGKFRKDLYYRLNVIPIFIPPLRERKDDIEALVFYFLDTENKKYNLAKKLAPSTLDILLAYSWPGNVRELKNVIERMVILAEGELIDESCIPGSIREETGGTKAVAGTEYDTYHLETILSGMEKEIIKKTLGVFGSLKSAAEQLGIDISTLVRKKKKYNI